MARRSNSILDTGERFPDLEFATVDHGVLEMPAWMAGHWGCLLVYRAHW